LIEEALSSNISAKSILISPMALSFLNSNVSYGLDLLIAATDIIYRMDFPFPYPTKNDHSLFRHDQ
jgi:hypothetical protein